MSTNTRGRSRSGGQHGIVRQRQDNVYSQIKDAVPPGQTADAVVRPFPKKPVSHRRLNPRTQDSPDLYDFEKINITKQPIGSLLPQGNHLNDVGETTGPQHPRKDSYSQPSRELQMARAIHAKELMLQEKLWKVEGVIRQKIQGDSIELISEDSRDGRQAEIGKAHMKTSLTEQHRRKAARSREMLTLERRQEDIKQLRRKQDPRNEYRARNAHEEEDARWKKREIEAAECLRSQKNENKGTVNNTANKQKMSGELNKSRWKNLKDHTGGKGDGPSHRIWGETSVRPKDGIKKAKEREQNKTPIGNIGRPGEKIYEERMYKDIHRSYDEREKPQISQEKPAHRLTTEQNRQAERKTSMASSHPPVSCPPRSSRPQREEVRLLENKDTDFKLLPCTICNRKFKSDRLEKHVQICKKVNQSHRQVFNSYVNRTKGSVIEEFWKTHSRSKTPEILQKKNKRKNQKVNPKGQLLA